MDARGVKSLLVDKCWRLFLIAWLILIASSAPGAGFFSNPGRVASLWPTKPLPAPIWETSDIGAVFQDDFNRDTLGTNWVVEDVNAAMVGNELQLVHTNTVSSRRMYYWPWLTSSDAWTIRWTQRFGALDTASIGVGVGIANFQDAGGDNRGYNGLVCGAGANLGSMQLLEFNGVDQTLVDSGAPMSLSAGDILDCSLTRSAWTMTATASNRANAQVSSVAIEFSDSANLIAPTISRVCFYPLGGNVYLDDLSFSINHRKPARFIVIGASISDGYNASSAARRYISVIQSNFTETVCNDSSSYNTTSNAVSILPEILAHEPGTAIVKIGSNDLTFGYPTDQWQSQYSNLVAQLEAAGVRVKHCFPTPHNNTDERPLKTWISAHYASSNIIDTFTPLVSGSFGLKSAYNSGDGVHPNDAGHRLLGQIIRTNLPP
jgi:lysophospholipase L1-like esterase